MAYTFNGTTDYLTNESLLPANVTPLTIAAWFCVDNVTGAKVIAGVGGQTGVAAHNFTILQNGTAFQARAQSNTATQAASTATLSGSTWYHGCGVFTGDTSRAAYINGANKGTDATSKIPVSAFMNKTRIGVFTTTTPVTYMAGQIAEVGVWNIALSDAEVAVLATGISPLAVRPDGLVAYWPLIGKYSPEIDLVGGIALTYAGTPTAAAHPRVMYVAQPYLPWVTATVPPAVTSRSFVVMVG